MDRDFADVLESEDYEGGLDKSDHVSCGVFPYDFSLGLFGHISQEGEEPLIGEGGKDSNSCSDDDGSVGVSSVDQSLEAKHDSNDCKEDPLSDSPCIVQHRIDAVSRSSHRRNQQHHNRVGLGDLSQHKEVPMYPEVPEEEGDVDDDSEQEGKGEVEDPAGRTRVRDQLLLGEIVSNMPSEGVVVHLFSRNKINILDSNFR